MEGEETRVAGIYKKADELIKKEAGIKLVETFIKDQYVKGEQFRSAADVLRRETMAQILNGKEHFFRMRTMFAAWKDGEGNINFPDGVMDWIEAFAKKNGNSDQEEGQSMGLSTIFYGVGEQSKIRGSDFLHIEKTKVQTEADRAGMIHTHAGIDYTFSGMDAERLVFDPEIAFSFLALLNGDVWLMTKTMDAVGFSRTYQENEQKIDELLKDMSKKMNEHDKNRLPVESANAQRLSIFKEAAPLLGIEIYKIPAGQNKAVPVVV